MVYIAGFVTPVPLSNRETYRAHAADALPLFRELGVVRMVEAWGDDVPEGPADFRRAVDAKPDEVVVFSWMEYPSKAAHDAANERMMNDPRAAEMMMELPFDGKRMIFGGFEPLIAEGAGTGTGYIDGMLSPVPASGRAAFLDHAKSFIEVAKSVGALRMVEAWGDFLPEGELTDFRRALATEGDEGVVFSWIEWPDKATRDAGWEVIGAHPVMQPESFTFDAGRLMYGGFEPIIDA